MKNKKDENGEIDKKSMGINPTVLQNVLDDIQSGRFAKEWIAENDEGLHKYNELREAA